MLFILSVESLKLFLFFWKAIYSYHPILLFRFLKHRVKNFFFFKSFFLSIPKVSTLPFRSFSYTIWGTFSSLAIIWNLYYKTRRAAQTASYAHPMGDVCSWHNVIYCPLPLITPKHLTHFLPLLTYGNVTQHIHKECFLLIGVHKKRQLFSSSINSGSKSTWQRRSAFSFIYEYICWLVCAGPDQTKNDIGLEFYTHIPLGYI